MKPWQNTILNRDRIVRVLTDEILSGKWAVGSRLPSQAQLATRFKTSRFPVAQAVKLLSEQGYLEARQGASAVVTARSRNLAMTDSAILCMNAEGHVYGDVTHLLLNRLHDLGLFAVTLSTGHPHSRDLICRGLLSEARYILVDAGASFPFDALDEKILRRKPVIAVLAWESEQYLDHVHRVLTDHATGMRLLTDHLWEAGHRSVLLAGAESMIGAAATWDGRGKCPARLNVQGTGFVGMWARRGGRLVTVCCDHEHARLDAGALPKLTGRDAPTAVVGVRDVDAWDVQEALRRDWPEALARLAVFGDGDTPWSKTAQPPFSTLNWNLEETVSKACDIIRHIETGKTFKKPVVHRVAPRLVLRG